MTEKKKLRVHMNAPVVLGFTFVSLIVLILSMITGGRIGAFLAVRYTSWLDPFMYLRLFTHVVTHQTIDHFTGNIMLILILGPMIEEKYGSRLLLFMIGFTAVITGLINILFFNHALIGASGIVFMLILLSSFTNMKQGTIPLTVILVAVLYLGNEILGGLFIQDNISRISHIAGGLCGAGFGFAVHKD